MKVSKNTKRPTFVLLTILAVFTLAFGAFSGVISSVYGALSDVGPNKKYFTSYSSPEELFEASAELNLELAREGFVLMKNNGALPLKDTERKVTVLGSYADQLFYGGGGSGGQFNPGPIPEGEAFNTPMYSAKTLYDSLDAVGIKYNPMTKKIYEHVNPTGVTGGSGAGLGGSSGFEAGPYMKKLNAYEEGSVEFADGYYVPTLYNVLYGSEHTFPMYNDAAIVVIARSGAEGKDNATHSQDYDDGTDTWENDPTVHYLELQEYEKQLIAFAKYYFDKVIVLLNSPEAMELGALENDPDIDAILWIGQPGYNGIMAVGEILTGKVNPSGRLVDFYMSDFTKDPTFYNFGNNAQVNGILNNQYEANTSLRNANGNTSKYNVIDYVEGIYMGYRYYETVYAELAKIDQQLADEWYAEAVVYPFGYGLSYTTFEQTIKSVKIAGDEKTTISADDADAKIVITVTVKNTGTVAGKEVVQVYNDPSKTYKPEVAFEKAAANLVGFTKTPVIQPDESVDVEVVVPVKELADFDYKGAVAGDVHKGGYVLEAGAYTLSIRANSHDVIDQVALTAEENLTWDEDGNPDTPNNIFSQPLDENATNVWAPYNTSAYNWSVSGQDMYLRRSELVTEDGQVADLAARLGYLQDATKNRFKNEAFNVLDAQSVDYSYEDYDNIITSEVETDYPNPWVKEKEDVAGWTQRETEYAPYSAPIQLYDMLGVPFDDPKWVEFMNQLTWNELLSLLDYAGFRTQALPSIGKEVIIDQDGPGQIKDAFGSGQIGNRVEGDPANKVVQAYDGHGQAWVCAVVIASTWNEELAYRQGLMVGEESIMYGINGWYAPATNIHRSPFAGRNFEYYSQDGFQAGVICAAVTRGCVEKGMHVYIKHAFLNDQETNRGGLVTFATEQAIRQIYAKPFEMAIRAGGNGVMASFNRVGLIHSLNYAITTQLYINEWGMDGFNITDWYNSGIGWTHTAMARGYMVPLNHPPQTAGNAPDGEWDPTLNDGKGGVVVPSWDPTANNGQGDVDFNNKVESPTTWWWTRMTAQKILYTLVNLNGMDNGYRDIYLNDDNTKDVVLTQNVDINTRISVFGEYENKVKEVLGPNGYRVEIVKGIKGLSVTPEGVIQGTPTEAGDLTLTVRMRGTAGQHYISDVADLKIKIVPKMNYNTLSGKLGDDFKATFTQSLINTANIVDYEGAPKFEYNGKIINFKITATGLPEGLTINNKTGEIKGKLTRPGQYTFKVTMSGISCSFWDLSRWGFGIIDTSSPFEYSATYTLTVEGKKNVVVFDYGFGEVVTSADDGETVEAPALPERYGYKFLGWTLAGSEDNALVDVSTYVINKDVTFKAVWEDLSLTYKEWEQGEDGYWYNFGQKTDKMWKGVQGETGPKGETGETGPKGKDAMVGNILGIVSLVVVVAVGAFVVVTTLRKSKAN